jgi:hypothetical protein
MKYSIWLTIVILALGAAAAIHQRQQVSALRQEAGQLSLQARKYGLDPASAQQSRRSRADHAGEVARLAEEIISMAEKTQAFDGASPDDATTRKAMELVATLAKLDAAQFLQVIKRLREGSDAQADAARARLVGFALLTLADDRPHVALAVCAECGDWLGKSPPGDQVVTTALGAWARQDPVAAFDWLDKNTGKFPQAGSDEAIDAILDGAARHDPLLAFRLLDRLDGREPQESLTAIIGTADESPEQRTALLAALRTHLATMQDPEQQSEVRAKALELMARGIDSQDFAETSDWLAAQRFTPQEIADFASGLTYFTTGRDSGNWIDWLAGHLPPGQLADPVREIVGEWTQQDYLAAGTWLSAAADGPAKAAAVEAYAAAVAEYEPQVAEQWALTLPAGLQREATLRAIRENWPAADPAGAEDFARKHRLDP